MNRKEICVVVFLDISGAFDRTWHYGILYRLIGYGVPIYLVAWLKEFLNGRSSFFMEGDNKHEVYLEQSCPPGGVLSPALWNVLFNDFLALPIEGNKQRGNRLKVIGYADDAAIVCKTPSVEEASKLVNAHLEKVYEWLVSNRVQFNLSKLAVMVISNREAKPPPASVFFNGTLINEVAVYKYLGLLVDNKLTWRGHINSVLEKLAATNRTFRGIAKQGWGVKLDVFRTIYHSIFYPIMMYGIAIWGWRATHNVMCTKFDRAVCIFGLMATRCLRSTPNTFLLQMLQTQEFAQILKNEVRKVTILQFNVLESKRYKVYENYLARMKREVPQSMDYFYFMCRKGVDEEMKKIVPDDTSRNFRTHPAEWRVPKICISDKIGVTWEAIDLAGWIIFTDASSSSYSMGWAYIVMRNGFCVKECQGALSKCSIFYAEAYAIYEAAKYINWNDDIGENDEVEIRSDSKGIIQALVKPVHVDIQIGMVSDIIQHILRRGIRLILRWVPSHSGIFGNDYADGLAKLACDKHAMTNILVTKSEAKRRLKTNILENKKLYWETLETKFTRTFLPTLSSMKSFISSSPSVTVCQLVSGHNRLNDFVCRKLGLINSPKCACGEARETEEHYIFECSLHDEVRNEIWPYMSLDYNIIGKDWKKLEEFVTRSRRFKDSRIKLHNIILAEGHINNGVVSGN